MKLLSRFAIIFTFGSLFVGIILYAKGYRLNLKSKKLQPTGIIAVNSYPKASLVFLNGKLVGATDINLNLQPGEWEIEVKKEGYTSWKKKVNLKEGVVISLDVVLFPKNPTLKPLTSIGVTKAVQIDNLDKLLLFMIRNDPKKDGVYLFDLNNGPISLKKKPQILVKLANYTDTEQLDIKNLSPIFSPDFKQFILTLSSKKYLFSTNPNQQEPLNITDSYKSLLDAWEKEKEKNNLDILKSFPDEFEKIATSSFEIISFSPDETKLLYKAKKNLTLPIFKKPRLVGVNPTKETRDLKKNKLYVYDKKEDKNYLITTESLPIWYSDSKHLVFVKDSSVAVIDYDGTNERIIYSGPFEKDFLSVNSKGNLILLLNLNAKINPLPDVYEVIVK